MMPLRQPAPIETCEHGAPATCLCPICERELPALWRVAWEKIGGPFKQESAE